MRSLIPAGNVSAAASRPASPDTAFNGSCIGDGKSIDVAEGNGQTENRDKTVGGWKSSKL